MNLRSLNLKFNEIGKEGGKLLFNSLIKLKNNPKGYKLVYLNLEGCRIQTEGLMEIDFLDKLYKNKKSLIQKFLDKNKVLEELNIGENEIDETGLIETFS